jgi:hypothetical protein
VEAYRHALTPAINGCWKTLLFGPLYHGKNTPGRNSIIGWIGLKAIMDVLEEMLPVEESKQDCPVNIMYPCHYTDRDIPGTLVKLYRQQTINFKTTCWGLF